MLDRAAESRGSSIRCVDMTPPTRSNLQDPHTPYLIRPTDMGQALVGGHVRLRSKDVTKAGTITTYDDTTFQYSIEFQDFSTQDFSTQVWTLMQDKRNWKTQRHGDLWSESDKSQLRAQTINTGTYVSHHCMEDRLFGPLSNSTTLVNARGDFASRYRPPKSGIPQITRG